MLFTSYNLLAVLSLLILSTSAQLTGPVGPITSLATKTAKKTCNVLNYGAKADGTTDVGPPLSSAFAACKTGGVVVVPAGSYALATWVTMSGGSAWAIQIDGIITRTGTAGGNMILIEHTSDVEVFSSTGKGAVQGNGYIFHQQGSLSGPRILRVVQTDRFSVHDLIFVDSPSFHFSMDTCTNGEVYNMAIRGGDHGGLDGIDVWSVNMWIHDVSVSSSERYTCTNLFRIMVTNKDECVTVKSPSNNILVENIYCNWSGGCAMGSLGTGTAISEITYRNVYTWYANQMYMIKSNGGSGTVSNVLLDNFIGHGNAYSLDIDQYWSSISVTAGPGITLDNITVNNWHGTESSGTSRGPVKVLCADGAPCTDFTISDFAMWTETGSKQWYSCRSAYGSGYCLHESGSSSYAVSSTTVSAAPSGFSAGTMPYDLKTGPGYTVSIPIPTMPASFFPSILPISPFAGGTGAATSLKAVVVTVTTSSSKLTISTTKLAVASSTKASSTMIPATIITSSSKASTTTNSKASTTTSGKASSSTSSKASTTTSGKPPTTTSSKASTSSTSSTTTLGNAISTSTSTTSPSGFSTITSSTLANISSASSTLPTSSTSAPSSAAVETECSAS